MNLSTFAVDGVCPACLVRAAVELDPVDPAYSVLALSPLICGRETRAFGRFELCGELGRGGMGVVYRARERATGRIVALKLTTPHLIARGEFWRRFQSEVKAAASLDHPHVLPIYEVGEHDGLPFFTMKLAGGGSLAAHLGDFAGRHRAIATLTAAVARGVAHAHTCGILHRDLKPANILLDTNEHPFVSDFGLVKWLAGDAAPAASSVLVGAPGYVAPEQIRRGPARAIGPPADVFSLGVVLYELLTGQRPFAATTLWEAVDRIEEGAYATPRSIARDVPHDLETICRKCLEGDPRRRYASAGALADDLERFLAGRPVHARPITTWTRAWKWARRNPWVASLSAGVCILLLAGGSGSTIAAAHLARAHDRAVRAESDARERLWESLVSVARALRTSTEVGHRAQALAALRQAAGIRFAPELRDEAIRVLTKTDLRAAAEWKSEIPFGAFSPDLEFYALEVPGRICEVRRTSDHATLASLPGRTSDIFACWRFSRDGETVSIIGKGGETWLWRWRENHVATIPYPLEQAPVCLEFSPDGKTIAAPGADGGVVVFDVAGRWRQTLAREVARPWAFAFSPGGNLLAVSSRSAGEVILVDVASGDAWLKLEHAAPVSCLAFSPDGNSLAAGTADSAVTLWHLPERTAHVLRGHSRLCENLVFSPDGRMLASSGYDQTVRFWDVTTRRPLVVLAAANASLFFNPTGSRLAIATEDSRWALFDVLTNRVQFDLRPKTQRLDDASMSLDVDRSGRWVAVGGTSGVRVYDAEARRELTYLPALARR
jgi:hypothetical protein